MNVSKKQELKNYVVNSIVHNAFDPNELLRLINLFARSTATQSKSADCVGVVEEKIILIHISKR